MASFGQELRDQRKYRGLTQSELGNKVGLSAQVISNLERGVTTSLDPDLVKSIAKALGTTPEKLLGLQPVTGTNASNIVIDHGDFSLKERIRQVMAEDGISEAEFSNRTGFDKEKTDRFLYSNPYPTVEELIRIARALNVTTDYLLELSDRKRISPADELLLRTVTPVEKKLLSTFRNLNEDYQDVVIGKAKEALIDQNKEDAIAGVKQAK